MRKRSFCACVSSAGIESSCTASLSRFKPAQRAEGSVTPFAGSTCVQHCSALFSLCVPVYALLHPRAMAPRRRVAVVAFLATGDTKSMPEHPQTLCGQLMPPVRHLLDHRSFWEMFALELSGFRAPATFDLKCCPPRGWLLAARCRAVSLQFLPRLHRDSRPNGSILMHGSAVDFKKLSVQIVLYRVCGIHLCLGRARRGTSARILRKNAP